MELLWLVPAIPFAGAAVLLLFGAAMRPKAMAFLGVATIAASAVISLLIAARFSGAAPDGVYRQYLWRWIDVDGFQPAFSLYLDALSLVMMVVVTFDVPGATMGVLAATEAMTEIPTRNGASAVWPGIGPPSGPSRVTRRKP